MTSDTASFPEPFVIIALDAVRSDVVTVDMAPAILLVRRVSKAVIEVFRVETLSEIAVLKSAPSNFTVAAVRIPTSRFEAVTGDKDVLDLGSFVSDSLNVFAVIINNHIYYLFEDEFEKLEEKC